MDGLLELPAVVLDEVRKSFGSKKNRVDVLQGVNLRVPTGSIYGLLGASGSGKTTALRCVIGRVQPDSGSISVFGKTPGSVDSNIPGSIIGYMPQEIALFGQLTARETLTYFGRIHKMTKAKINERTEFLLEFFKIPKAWRLIKDFSEGQRRRISFAISLLHEPRLLILDEPTVGVDPTLRTKIWEHLLSISLSGRVTTIITTHYIEEARKAHKVGIIRDGKALAEDNPDSLLSRYQRDTLEDVFLQLCESDNEPFKPSRAHLPGHGQTILQSEPILEEHASLDNRKRANQKIISRFKHLCSPPVWMHIFALIVKNNIKMIRSPTTLLFQFILPAFQIAILCLAFGNDPHNLKISVVNEDNLLGGKFLSFIDNVTVIQVPVDNIETAENMVSEGSSWGLIHIWKNFSTSLSQRYFEKDNTTLPEYVLRASNIHIRLDMTEHQNAITIQRRLFQASLRFEEEMLSKLGKNDSLTHILLDFGEPINGPSEPNFVEYLAPGAIILICYFMAVGLTAMEFTVERKEGLLDRSYVAGVTPFELMISHILAHLGTLVIQINLLLLVLIVAFHFPLKGSFMLVGNLVMLQGICGMIFGYLLAILLDEEYSIIACALGNVFPTVLLSGIIWPLEAMPWHMQKVSHFLPQTYAIKALRSIFLRGHGISSMYVWRGYLATQIWIVVFLVLIVIVQKIRKI